MRTKVILMIKNLWSFVISLYKGFILLMFGLIFIVLSFGTWYLFGSISVDFVYKDEFYDLRLWDNLWFCYYRFYLFKLIMEMIFMDLSLLFITMQVLFCWHIKWFGSFIIQYIYIYIYGFIRYFVITYFFHLSTHWVYFIVFIFIFKDPSLGCSC